MTSPHDKYAKEYDEQIKNYDCYIAEVLFGLTYEYIKAGESILDVGIGTGISSKLYNQAGLQVFGVDNSGEMLKICEKKGIARQLTRQDLLLFPWPYQDEKFDHVISCGVFHFIGDLDRLFKEIYRILKPNGIFVFTIMEDGSDKSGKEKYIEHIDDGVSVFSHQAGYIYDLIKDNHFWKLKEIISSVGQTQFRAIVVRKGMGQRIPDSFQP